MASTADDNHPPAPDLSDFDEAELTLRFYRTWGYVPVYIHKVGTEEGRVDVEEDQG